MKHVLVSSALGVVLLAQGMLAQSTAAPQATAGPEGHWEGAIALPGTSLEVQVDLDRDGAAWRATIDIPQQDAHGLPLQAVRFEAPSVHFELQAGPGRRARTELTGRGALTSAESRVCRQAAEGLTNREIAQALFVTEKTVERHLSSAYQKLGIRSRFQVGAAIAE